MRSLLVSEPRKPLLCCSKELPLILTSKLDIDVEVLLVQHLEDGVKETGQGRIVSLFDDFSASLLSIVFRDDGAELVDVHDILWTLLVGAAENETKLRRWYADGLEDGCYHMAVVFGAVLDELDRGLEVVKESMLGQRSVLRHDQFGSGDRVHWRGTYNIGKKDSHLTASCEILSNLDGRDEVTTVRPARCGSSWANTSVLLPQSTTLLTITYLQVTYPSRSWDAGPRRESSL